MTALSLNVILAPLKEFYVGEDYVTGSVAVSAVSATACKGIWVRIRGIAKVEWGYDEEDRREAEETYVENSVTLWSGTNFGDNLGAGEFSFPFEFKLPPNIPSTYEGSYGSIRYFVEAKAEPPFGPHHSARSVFRVKGHCDLNNYPENSAVKTGYIPGESVLLSGKIINKSDQDAEYTKIAIRETIKFMAGSHTKKKKEVIRKIRRPGFRAGEIDVWASYPIQIPESAVCLQNCNIISAKYVIEVTCVLGFCTEAYVKEVINVGSVPVGEVRMTLDDGEPTKYDATIKPSAPPLEASEYELQPILQQPESVSPLVI